MTNQPDAVTESRLDVRAVWVSLLCSALWGGNAVAIRYAVDDLPPIGMAGLRFLQACLFMLVWCRCAGTSLTVRAAERGPIVIAGVLLFVQIALINLGARYTSSAHTSVFINTYPLFVALMLPFSRPREPLSGRMLAGLALAFGALALVLLMPESEPTPSAEGPAASTPRGDPTSLVGDLLVLASAVALAANTLYIKHGLRRVVLGRFLLWHQAVATVLFFSVSLIFEGTAPYRFTPAAITAVLYQGFLVAGLVFALWTTLLRRYQAAQLSVFSFTTPLFGVLAGHLLRGDDVGAILVVSGVGVALGIYLVTTGRQPM